MVRPPCRFFLFRQGGCRAKRCGFEHEIRPEHLSKSQSDSEARELIARLNAEQRSNCKHFYIGKCNDVNCAYAHVLEQRHLHSDIIASIGFRGNAKQTKKQPEPAPAPTTAPLLPQTKPLVLLRAWPARYRNAEPPWMPAGYRLFPTHPHHALPLWQNAN